LRAAPLASRSAVSLVDPSPSTERRLKLWSAASRSATARRNAGESSGVGQQEASIVAMSGSIMPTPFAIPAIVTARRRFHTTVEGVLRDRVGRHDRAARRRRARSATAPPPRRRPAADLSAIGSGCPITPVEATSTCSARAPIARAAAAAIAAASRRPPRAHRHVRAPAVGDHAAHAARAHVRAAPTRPARPRSWSA